ncbi:hypothetical protein [Bradyrhizobium sp. JYMT SZCCT0428]|uniref:hypothetical protein n=1 Tax=Bradyrhizobium sp. JYMT SZCCT0428 TaxID=2807673 RepID=UPI001BAB2A4C|nr:hypothetical protein [Bradyrhizobium sp. JYMT SZCCT0428]MBR1150113.1 hypothetical protein [Bradyrhizobium sp. JYMT SZCCT0428]
MAHVEKIKVDEAELKILIQHRLGMAAYLTVHRHAELGFTVTVLASPSNALRLQQAVDVIVGVLRGTHELVD